MSRPLPNTRIADEEIPVWSLNYLCGCPTPADPTIVWGTDVDCTGLNEYLKQLNLDSPVLLTPVHVLLRATACALARHPEFNRRVLRRRAYQYKQINLLLPFRRREPPQTEVMLLEDVNRKSLVEIARDLWQQTQEAARGHSSHERLPILFGALSPSTARRLFYGMHLWLANRANLPASNHSKRHRTAATMINYLGFRGAPPLRSLKPSRAPYDGIPLNITMGATELRPVVVDGEIVPRPIAPLIVRADHRLVDAHDMAAFIGTLRDFIASPATTEFGLESAPPAPEAVLVGSGATDGKPLPR